MSKSPPLVNRWRVSHPPRDRRRVRPPLVGAPPAGHLIHALAIAIAVAVVVAVVTIASAEAVAAPCWQLPVDAPVSDPFRPPPCPWCAGNRGLEYDVSPPTVVRSVAAGTVTFAGSVAGTVYVVVELPNGWRLTYGRLAGTRLQAGDGVLAGTRIGATGRQFFFGLRIGDTYHDPARYLGRWVGTPRLIPLDGSAPRAAPPVQLRCS
jgi:murein DD-endopeptidase MepM/ murein hydrolase activator NlpD